MSIVKIILWIAVILFLFPYIIYPIIIKIMALLKDEDEQHNEYKSISLIIPAYNEKNIIQKKIKNTLELNYPEDKIEILIGSDGSNDGTNDIVDRLCKTDDRIKFYNFKQRRGKISVLNDLVKEAKNDIVVFSDANCMLNNDCLINIDKHFCNNDIGGVSGVKKIDTTQNASTSKNEGLYWKFESFIKKNESRYFSIIGADGAIFAIRRNLYIQQEQDTILDDFMISMQILIKKNKRIVYETNAIAYEKSESNYKNEFKRKVRIAAGAFQSLKKIGIINPFTYYGFGLIFHKILRWIGVIFLFICFICNAIILNTNNMFYNILFLLQILYYFIFFITFILCNKNIKVNKLMNMIFYFNLTIFAQMRGFIKFINKNQKVTWEKTNR